MSDKTNEDLHLVSPHVIVHMQDSAIGKNLQSIQVY